MTAVGDGRSEGSLRAETFYNAELRKKLEPDEDGMFIVIDSQSLDYEVDANLIVATVHLQDRRPDAQMFSFRIGYDKERYILHGKRMTLK